MPAGHGDPAAAADAFKRAKHVVALNLVNQRVAHAAIEPRSTLATYDAASGRLTLLTSCQTPTGLRDELCDAVLKIPKESVRVVVGDVGGGFGMKTSLYPEDVVVAFAARELKQPVRFTAERIEEFLEENHCPVLAMYEGSWLHVHGDRAHVTGPARLFERSGCESFADGVDVSRLLQLTPAYDQGQRPAPGTIEGSTAT